jgi:hypothetical protein
MDRGQAGQVRRETVLEPGRGVEWLVGVPRRAGVRVATWWWRGWVAMAALLARSGR